MGHPALLQVRSGLWLGRAAIRAGCLALMLALLGLFAAGVPARARQLSTVAGTGESVLVPFMPPALEAVYASRLGPSEIEALQAFGLSLTFYAHYQLAFEIGLALVCGAVGLFIFSRHSVGWLTLWVPLVLVLLGTTAVSFEAYALPASWPGWEVFPNTVGLLGMLSFLHILYLVPDGRFVPRWGLRLVAAFAGGTLALVLFSVAVSPKFGPLVLLAPFVATIIIWLVFSVFGIVSQVYRYRHVSGPVERQQIKWVAVGLAAVTAGILMNVGFLYLASQTSGLARLLVNFARSPLVNLCMVGLPLSLAFSILRYRLWDIDLIIRRTLVYASLTAALALVYLACVVALQALVGGLTGQNRSDLVTVLSTLAIAALFGPLRQRVQFMIDRRFYRRKYDAAQVLTAFGTSLRDETDLDRLSARLEGVVQQTMQPDAVGLWLRPPRG